MRMDSSGAQHKTSMSLELAMFDILRTVATKEPSKTSGPYRALVLAYISPAMEICRSARFRKKEH